MKPNFIGVGAIKAGTTSLYAMLKEHPEVFMSEVKELNYFNEDSYQKENFMSYYKHFENANGHKVIGEITPLYLYGKNTPRRIYELLGEDVKIIIILRNPIERALSHYKMNLRNKNKEEPLTFEEAFYREKEEIGLDEKNASKFVRYFTISLYSEQVKRYMELFPNIKIILFEEFINNSNNIQKEIFEFLEIENCNMEVPKVHVGHGSKVKYFKVYKILQGIDDRLNQFKLFKKNNKIRKIKRKIKIWFVTEDKNKTEVSEEFKQVLRNYYYEDICALEKLIHRDLSVWKK